MRWNILDGDQLVPSQSRYANYILNLLRNKGQGQLLNRGEVIQDDQGVEYMSLNQYRLEPEWVVVLIATLVREFNFTLTVPGKKFDAMNLAELVNTPVRELKDFRHLKTPKDYDTEALKALYNLLELETGSAVAVTQGGKAADDAIQKLLAAVVTTIQKLVLAQQSLQGKLSLLGRQLLTEPEQREYRTRLDSTKGFLESLQAYNSPGKLKNFRYDATEVNAQRLGLETLREVEYLQKLVRDLGVSASYLSQAALVLPSEHSWVRQMKIAWEEILAQINNPNQRNSVTFPQQTAQRLGQLKQEYVNAYMMLHTQARLGNSEDERKSKLKNDPRLQNLIKLATISVMDVNQLTKFQEQLDKLKTCSVLTELELQAAPICPHCEFKPVNEELQETASNRLQAMDGALDHLVVAWTERLLGSIPFLQKYRFMSVVWGEHNTDLNHSHDPRRKRTVTSSSKRNRGNPV